MISRFRSILRVSVFQGLLLIVIVIMAAGKNAIVKVAFDLYSSHVCEKCRNKSIIY